MRDYVAILVILLGLASPPATVRASEPWPTYLHDNQHTGRANFALDPRNLSKVPSWSAPTGYSLPLVVGDRVYAMRSQFGIGGDLTSIAAFDLATGEILWEQLGSFIFPSAPAYHDGRIVYAALVQATFEPILFVLDATTGFLLYEVAIPNPLTSMPTIHEDEQTGEVVAYLSAPRKTNLGSGPNMTAVTLGTNSGSVKWSDPLFQDFDSTSIPTIVEDSLVVVGPGRYYAYHRETGAVNRFHLGSISGGGGVTVSYDPGLRQIYIVEMLDSPDEVLTAWTYNAYDDIQFAWMSPETTISGADGVAIDGEGYLWAASYTTLYKINPTDGSTVASTDGEFATQMVPIMAGDYIWTFESSMHGDTVVYDMRTLAETRRFRGARGDLNTAFDAPGALAPGAFLLDHGRIYDYPGFDVFLRIACGTPVSGGAQPIASDALAVLRASVELHTCALCYCDVDESGAIRATDSLIVLNAAVGLGVQMSCPLC